MNSIHIISYVLKFHLRPGLSNGLFPGSLYEFLKKTTEVNIIGPWQICHIQLGPGSVCFGVGVRNVKWGNFILISAYTIQSSTLQVQGLSINRGHTRRSMRESHIEIVAASHYDETFNRKDTTFPLCIQVSFLLFVQRTYKVKTLSIIQAYKQLLFISFL
jgi:hypothetical protein